MKTRKRHGKYDDGTEVELTEIQKELDTGFGTTIPGNKALYLGGNPLTPINDDATRFRDVVTGREVQLEELS
jgi:hypothetical protein